MKRSLLEEISIFLLKQGFTVKSITRTCFDLVARNDSQILLLKILEDANAVNKEYSEEMKRIASYLSATPLIIAQKAGDKLMDNVVYQRFDVHVLNLPTLESCIHNKFPFVKSDHAGITADIDGNLLKRKREEGGISLNSLAQKLGVSKKMIQKYETGKSSITVQKAFKLYDVFGHQVFNKVDVFHIDQPIQHDEGSDVLKKYTSLGFEGITTRKVPFDILAKKDKEIILTEVTDKPRPQAQSLSKLLNADNLVIFKKKRPKDVASIKKDEFLEIEKVKELLKILKEF